MGSMVTFGCWGNVVSANNVFVGWSGLVNCPERMMALLGLGRQAAEETCLYRQRGQIWVPLAVRLSHCELVWGSCEGMQFEITASWGSLALDVVDMLMWSLCGAWSLEPGPVGFVGKFPGEDPLNSSSVQLSPFGTLKLTL